MTPRVLSSNVTNTYNQKKDLEVVQSREDSSDVTSPLKYVWIWVSNIVFVKLIKYCHVPLIKSVCWFIIRFTHWVTLLWYFTGFSIFGKGLQLYLNTEVDTVGLPVPSISSLTRYWKFSFTSEPRTRRWDTRPSISGI